MEQATAFILACYNQQHCKTLTRARQEARRSKVGKALSEPPKLCTLPPTTESFHQNVKRAHLQVAVWRKATAPDPPALSPTDHGLKLKEGTTSILPIVVEDGVPLAPEELLSLIRCSCSGPNLACNPKSRCKCKNSNQVCTIFCACKTLNLLCHNPVHF